MGGKICGRGRMNYKLLPPPPPPQPPPPHRTAVFQVTRDWPFPLHFFFHLFLNRNFRISGTGFYGPDVITIVPNPCSWLFWSLHSNRYRPYTHTQACRGGLPALCITVCINTYRPRGMPRLPSHSIVTYIAQRTSRCTATQNWRSSSSRPMLLQKDFTVICFTRNRAELDNREETFCNTRHRNSEVRQNTTRDDDDIAIVVFYCCHRVSDFLVY